MAGIGRLSLQVYVGGVAKADIGPMNVDQQKTFRKISLSLCLFCLYHTLQTLMIANSREDVEQEEQSSIAGGNANLCNHFGSQCGNFSENRELTYLRIQPYHSLENTQKMLNHKMYLFNYAHSSIICDSQNLEKT